MRYAHLLLWLLLANALPLSAQDAPPDGFAAFEIERTRSCVDVLTRLEALDDQLTPMAGRAQRLLGIAGAVRLEESAVVDSLDVTDSLELAVAEWFRADSTLAQRYLTEQSEVVLTERATAKQAILQRLAQRLESVQAQADSVVTPTGTLRSDATACSGAILVRGPAVEACTGATSRVCQAARESTSDSPFRFIDSADFLWDRQEFRPWTSPGRLQLSPQGQLTGARTVGATRVGNVAVSLAFSPMLRARAELAPDQIEAIDSIDVALGIESSHPDITFVPALSLQANLPRPIAGEAEYLLHFGPSETPDILWAGNADTGRPLAASVALAPEHVARLRAGDPMTLTAIREGDGAEPEGLYAIELTSLNQVPPVEALLGYMSRQLSADLTQLIPPAADSASPTDSTGIAN